MFSNFSERDCEWQVHHQKFFSTEYERSKAIADEIALQAASEGIPIVPVYPGVIYGPGKVTAGNVIARMVMPCAFSDKFSWVHVVTSKKIKGQSVK